MELLVVVVSAVDAGGREEWRRCVKGRAEGREAVLLDEIYAGIKDPHVQNHYLSVLTMN